jgi:hypothetical protein
VSGDISAKAPTTDWNDHPALLSVLVEFFPEWTRAAYRRLFAVRIPILSVFLLTFADIELQLTGRGFAGLTAPLFTFFASFLCFFPRNPLRQEDGAFGEFKFDDDDVIYFQYNFSTPLRFSAPA